MTRSNYWTEQRANFGWLVLVFALLLLIQESCFGTVTQGVTLAWSPTTGASGYAIYYGATNGPLSTRVDAGTNTTSVIPGLTPGAAYYFVVVAYDANGMESLPSNEILFSLPVPLMMLSLPRPGVPATFQFTGAAGHWYELQASKDLRNWARVWESGMFTLSGIALCVDVTQATPDPQRFYRLVVH